MISVLIDCLNASAIFKSKEIVSLSFQLFLLLSLGCTDILRREIKEKGESKILCLVDCERGVEIDHTSDNWKFLVLKLLLFVVFIFPQNQ